MAAERSALPLRIVIDQPIPGVAIALQRGSGSNCGLIAPVGATGAGLVFEFDIIVHGDTAAGGARLLGPFVQGRHPRASSTSISARWRDSPTRHGSAGRRFRWAASPDARSTRWRRAGA